MYIPRKFSSEARSNVLELASSLKCVKTNFLKHKQECSAVWELNEVKLAHQDVLGAPRFWVVEVNEVDEFLAGLLLVAMPLLDLEAERMKENNKLNGVDVAFTVTNRIVSNLFPVIIFTSEISVNMWFG